MTFRHILLSQPKLLKKALQVQSMYERLYNLSDALYVAGFSCVIHNAIDMQPHDSLKYKIISFGKAKLEGISIEELLPSREFIRSTLT